MIFQCVTRDVPFIGCAYTVELQIKPEKDKLYLCMTHMGLQDICACILYGYLYMYINLYIPVHLF